MDLIFKLLLLSTDLALELFKQRVVLWNLHPILTSGLLGDNRELGTALNLQRVLLIHNARLAQINLA